MKPMGLSWTFMSWARQIVNVAHGLKDFPKSRCFSIRISSLSQNDLNKEDRSGPSACLTLHLISEFLQHC